MKTEIKWNSIDESKMERRGEERTEKYESYHFNAVYQIGMHDWKGKN